MKGRKGGVGICMRELVGNQTIACIWIKGREESVRTSGLKTVSDKVSFWGERRDYWSYLSEVVSKMKTLDGCVKRVQGISQVCDSLGCVIPLRGLPQVCDSLGCVIKRAPSGGM